VNVVDIKAPHDIEAEMAVLGAIMLDNRKLSDVMSILSPTDFYRFAHSIIFDAMKSLHDYNDPIDEDGIKPASHDGSIHTGSSTC